MKNISWKVFVFVCFFACFSQFLFAYHVALHTKYDTVITGTLLKISPESIYIVPDGQKELQQFYQKDLQLVFVSDLSVYISVPIVYDALPSAIQPFYSYSFTPATMPVDSTYTAQASPALMSKNKSRFANNAGLYLLLGGHIGMDMQGSKDIDEIFSPYFALGFFGFEYGLCAQVGYNDHFQMEYRVATRKTSLILSPEYTSDDDSEGMTMKSKQFLFKIAPQKVSDDNLVVYLVYGNGSSKSFDFNKIPGTGFFDGSINTYGIEFCNIESSGVLKLATGLGIGMEYERVKYKKIGADYEYAKYKTSVGTFRINFKANIGLSLAKI